MEQLEAFLNVKMIILCAPNLFSIFGLTSFSCRSQYSPSAVWYRRWSGFVRYLIGKKVSIHYPIDVESGLVRPIAIWLNLVLKPTTFRSFIPTRDRTKTECSPLFSSCPRLVSDSSLTNGRGEIFRTCLKDSTPTLSSNRYQTDLKPIIPTSYRR